MARRVYETQEDRNNESVICEIICKHYKVIPIKFPHCMRVDYVLSDETSLPVLGFLEVKDRQSYSVKSIPDLMLSYNKYQYGCGLSVIFNSPFFIGARMKEGVYVHRANPNEVVSIKKSGRSVNKRDEKDIENCVHLPWSAFTKIL
jgi:hypothetical protein